MIQPKWNGNTEWNDMLNIIVGVIVALHGLVHLLYAGQSLRKLELVPGMTWPDGSWALSTLLGDAATRTLAAVVLTLIGLCLAAGGIGIAFNKGWSPPLVVGAAASSIVVYLLLWDGALRGLDTKGGVGMLISLLILVAVLAFRVPRG
jgi:hypothetical protein